MPLVTRHVELSDGGDAEDVLPVVLLAEDLEHLRLVGHRHQVVGILGVGQAEQKSVAIGHKIKQDELTRFDEQRPVEIVGGVAERIVSGVKRTATLKQAGLALQTISAEAGHGFVRGTRDAME